MNNQLLVTGLSTALAMSVFGMLPPTSANQQSQDGVEAQSSVQSESAANPEVEGSVAKVEEAVKVGAQQSLAGEQASEKVIAKIHQHQLSGRNAVTLYVRKIPVATFLGGKINADASSRVKVASPKSSGSLADSDLEAASWKDPVWRATTIAAKINQLSQADADADAIGVIWDKERRSYVIRVKDEHLLEMDEKTIPPNSTKDVGDDALKITNLLRQQVGKAAPLSEIPGRPQPPAPTLALGPVRFQLNGMASWYGPGFHGNLTANGERYNQYGLTAAHKTLPFGTRVRVTNLYNGQSVTVRINDRGPYSYGRIIDLSKGAAQVIGVMNSGVAPVRVDVLQ